MQQVNQFSSRVPGSKTTAFLKRSFFFSFLSATLLYVLVRIFFYEFPFTTGECFDLYSRILLVIWIFLIACKLIFTIIVLAENYIGNIQFSRPAYASLIKKTIVVILTAVLVYAGKKQVVDNGDITNAANTSKDEQATGTDYSFLIKLPI